MQFLRAINWITVAATIIVLIILGRVARKG